MGIIKAKLICHLWGERMSNKLGEVKLHLLSFNYEKLDRDLKQIWPNIKI